MWCARLKEGARGQALTDNDTVDGLPEAVAAGDRPVEVIPEVEISAQYHEDRRSLLRLSKKLTLSTISFLIFAASIHAKIRITNYNLY
jgi:predicted metal-dependent phosphoesterase TrpH